MKILNISNELFLKLQALAVPFVDTPETVIARALVALESNENQKKEKMYPIITNGSCSHYKVFNELPKMMHTRPLWFVLDKIKVTENKWNAVNKYVHITAAKLVGIDKLLLITKANMQQGKIHGFDFINDLGCSIQRSDAGVTLKQITHLVDALDMEFEVEFEWKNNGKSEMSGNKGVLTLNSFYEGL